MKKKEDYFDHLLELKKNNPKEYKNRLKEMEDVIADTLNTLTNIMSEIKINEVKNMDKPKPARSVPKPVKKK